MRSTARYERGIVADVLGSEDEVFDVDLQVLMTSLWRGELKGLVTSLVKRSPCVKVFLCC